MNLLDRYLAKRFLRSFLAVLLGVCALYGVIDFADRAGDYTGTGWFVWVLRLYGNRLAKVAVLVSPAAMLIAAGLTLSALRARSELVAALAGGRSAARMVVPLALCSLLVGLAVYQFDDSIAVHSALKAERISAEHFHIWGAYRTYLAPKRWLKLEGRILQLGDALPEGGFKDVSIFEMSKDFSLLRRIDAETMVPAGGDGWLLRGVQLRSFDAPDGAKGQFERAPELRARASGGYGHSAGGARPTGYALAQRAAPPDRRAVAARAGSRRGLVRVLQPRRLRARRLRGHAARCRAGAAREPPGQREHGAARGAGGGGRALGIPGHRQGALRLGQAAAAGVCLRPWLLGVAAGLALLAQVNRRTSW